VTEYVASKMNLAEDKDKLTLGFSVMQVVISPQSLLETGIIVEKIDDLRLFKFTDDLQDKLEGLLEKNQVAMLTAIEREELESISELDRIFTYLNSLLAAQK
jgi:hypothetical protein